MLFVSNLKVDALDKMAWIFPAGVAVRKAESSECRCSKSASDTRCVILGLLAFERRTTRCGALRDVPSTCCNDEDGRQITQV